MPPAVTLIIEGGHKVGLEPGDLIGRAAGSALRIGDSRISEAHALVSRRRDGLSLLALRGRISVDGKPKTRVCLEPGMRILLAGYYPIVVEELANDRLRLAVVADVTSDEAAGPLPIPLSRVVSIFGDARAPVGYFDYDASAFIAPAAHGARWWAHGAAEHPLAVGDSLSVGARSIRLVAIDEDEPPVSTTDRGQFDQALRLVVRFDTVLITNQEGRGLTLDGNAARVISELAEIRSPVAWSELARMIWGTPPDAATRHRWDQLLVRIRSRLREVGIRADIVRANRNGLVELALGPGDKVQVRT